ncbi:hypothetical protein SARC_00456 [Sphaeroforma arctica JP610]|uniref:Uncharacterized protein n=1 Tax=Sphaeroforma arctica JP610 TaxID=667725 RepID=A0A0L0GEW3_9EUKA|nr:hypothetical protein SARC_00456 [Sphaeroforma arctica JP610]KNC87419.1 hypothetical protein SARC_00456 [Sphaeroforma arctica JP610]|eukprot:XP_014161321.1 hypothetical protein SARC_00456 [Sphaeroforma arctica JP610]
MRRLVQSLVVVVCRKTAPLPFWLTLIFAQIRIKRLTTCCAKSVVPVTGEEVKTCAMLLADDPELCSSNGEVDTDDLDIDCDKNCDINCCKHTETPVTGESVDTCFMLLVKDHDLCQGYIVDTDSLDNTCETNCDKNCCKEETLPATDSETKRTCAMWLADNSGLCTDQGNIVDKDSLSKCL